MKKVLLALAALALVAGFTMASLAVAANRATTIVTIKGPEGDFHGRVKSERKGCLGGRTVKVFKQKGDRQNPKRDKVIAKDTSERSGDHGV
jgi:ABC-type sugar transport system substrate-binding protein